MGSIGKVANIRTDGLPGIYRLYRAGDLSGDPLFFFNRA